MRKFTMMIAVAAILLSTAQAYAEDPVMPPIQQPNEVWEISYDNYKVVLSTGGSNELSHKISAVRDGNDLYFQGLFTALPEAWVKCTQRGWKLSIPNSQLIDIAEDGTYTYFHGGYADGYFSSGNTYEEHRVMFLPANSALLEVSEDGNTITYKGNPNGDGHSCFWYDSSYIGKKDFVDGIDRSLDITGHEKNEPYGNGIPDIDYMVNIKLQKVGISGIQGIGSDNDTTAPMYDLQGRIVDPAAAAPGIYIRNGRKIVLTGR